MKFFFLLFSLFFGFATAHSKPNPLDFSLPSAKPSGNAQNDRIWLTFYPAQNVQTPAPAAILLHPLGGELEIAHRFARYLAERGVGGIVMELPFHYRRAVSGERAVDHFIASNAPTSVQAFEQSVSDVKTTLDWLEKQPSVDAEKLGVAGISLGAIITHIAMGQDARLKAGVALLGGGDLADIAQLNIIGRLFLRADKIEATPEKRALLAEVDPLSFAEFNRPRRVLMIQAARDDIIPTKSAENLWKALGKPPIQWLDINHPGLQLVASSAMKTSLAYLQNVWNGTPEAPIPKIRAITLKTGVIFGLDSVVSPAIQWQALTLIKKSNHQSLLHGDIGYMSRGPFVGLAATLNSYVDIGVGRRVFGSGFKPYASVHIVF